MQVFRPHNVYGPDMGWKHVVPQLITKIQAAAASGESEIELQGDGRETRAFCYVDDVVDGILTMWEKGATMNVYHIGSMEEVTIRDLAQLIAGAVGTDIALVPGPAAEGGTPRRCPDIGKLRKLGYEPAVNLRDGIARTARWYLDNPRRADANELL